MHADELVRERHLSVNVHVVAIVLDASLDQEISLRVQERTGDVQDATALQDHLANVRGAVDVHLEDVGSVLHVREFLEDLVEARLQLLGGPTGERERQVGSEVDLVGVRVDVFEDERTRVPARAVDDEGVRTIFLLHCLSEVLTEEVPQLVLLDRVPVLLEQVGPALEKVTGHRTRDAVAREKAVEEIGRPAHGRAFVLEVLD